MPILITAVLFVLLWSPVPALAQNALERARAYYNEGRYDESIAAATAASSRPDAAPSATLIIARSHLGRYRASGEAKELDAARAALVTLNPRALAPQEAIEWQIGAGTALFFENQFGPAADMFSTVLPLARERLKDVEFEKLVEWWGSTQARLAETLAGDSRTAAYERLRDEATLEVQRNPLSRPATYWMIVGLRGAGDLQDAWSAAISGWIRFGGQPDGEKLRADLDHFVVQTLIPERAQAKTGQRLDTRAALDEIAVMTEEWRNLTARWGSKDN
jgi:hypothetical protein